MILFQNLVRIDKNLAEPVYQQLANGVVSLIRHGHLKPGAALPSSRKLSEIFDIHRKTVVAAFEELQAQGWVEAVPRRGLFVASELPVVKATALTGGAGQAPTYELGTGYGTEVAGAGNGVGAGIKGSLIVAPARGIQAYPAQTDFP